MSDINEKITEFTNTEDHSAEVGGPQNDNDKLMGILSYLGILVLVPIFAAKDSTFARFHANQGLVLFLAEAILGCVVSILGFIPYIGWLFSVLGGLVSLAALILSVIGIINVVNGTAKELPVIGKVRILK